MDFEWIGSDRILYDGKILAVSPGEWGVVDAIREYDAEKEKQISKQIKRILEMEKAKEPYWDVVKERDHWKKIALSQIELNRELENEISKIKNSTGKLNIE